jgi:hypothetical protein
VIRLALCCILLSGCLANRPVIAEVRTHPRTLVCYQYTVEQFVSTWAVPIPAGYTPSSFWSSTADVCWRSRTDPTGDAIYIVAIRNRAVAIVEARKS